MPRCFVCNESAEEGEYFPVEWAGNVFLCKDCATVGRSKIIMKCRDCGTYGAIPVSPKNLERLGPDFFMNAAEDGINIVFFSFCPNCVDMTSVVTRRVANVAVAG